MASELRLQRSLAQHHGKCDVLLASSSVRLLESQLYSLVSQNPGRCGDVYVTIEGGEALADIAKRIAKRPLVDIVPIIRSGGASSGEFGFPLPSRPKGVSESGPAHFIASYGHFHPAQSRQERLSVLVSPLVSFLCFSVGVTCRVGHRLGSLSQSCLKQSGRHTNQKVTSTTAEHRTPTPDLAAHSFG